MSIQKIASLIVMLCLTAGAYAQTYDKQPARGEPEKTLPEAFTNSQTFFQACLIGGSLTCQNSSNMGTRYTSGSAYSVLTSSMNCTYRGSTLVRANSPGYDLYYCGAGSTYPGFTIFVLVEGDLSSSFAGTITAIFQP